MAPWIKAGGEPDWSGTVVEVLRQGRQRGFQGARLVRLAEEHLGPRVRPEVVRIAVFHAFEIPMGWLQEARRWRGWHPGPDAMSDREFDELLASWI